MLALLFWMCLCEALAFSSVIHCSYIELLARHFWARTLEQRNSYTFTEKGLWVTIGDKGDNVHTSEISKDNVCDFQFMLTNPINGQNLTVNYSL